MLRESRKKSILLITDWFYPGFRGGGPITSCLNLVKYLRNYFDFYVVTRNHDYMSEEPYRNVPYDCWCEVMEGASVYYVSPKNLSTRRLKKIFDEVPWDVAYINGVFSFYFSILPLFFLKKQGKKIVVSPRGALLPPHLKLKWWKKYPFLGLAKFGGIYRNVVFHATSEEEAFHIRRLLGNVPVITIPNMPAPLPFSFSPPPKHPGVAAFVTVGRIAPEKNFYEALELLNNIPPGKGKIIYHIYGPVYDRAYYRRCLSLAAKKPEWIDIQFKGAIPSEDIAKTIRRYHFYLCLSSESFGHSILEAMGAGLPVIAMDSIPWRDAHTKRAGFIASTMNDLALYIMEALKMDKEYYSRMSARARSYAEEITSHLLSNIDKYIALFSPSI